MKKLSIAFILGLFLLPATSFAASSGSDPLYPSTRTPISGSDYWSYVQNYYQKKQQGTSTVPASSVTRPRYTTRGRTSSSQYSSRYRTTPTRYSRYNSYAPRTRTTAPTSYRTQTTTNTYGSTQNQSYARISTTPQPQRQPQETINNAVIDVLEVGVHHESGRRSSLYFQEALVVNSMKFQMYAQSGIARDPNDFELVIGDSTTPFDANGSVTVRFQNAARVAAGESFNFDVGVRFRDPDLVSRENGNFRLRLLEANIVKETSYESVAVQVSGSGTSGVIAFQPQLGTSGGGGTGVFTTIPTNNVFSSSLQAGQEATVLALGLGAQYDDLSIEEITVRNTTGGSLIDDLVDRIDAINISTGEILGSARFIGGNAHFEFTSPVYVRRNKRLDIAFVAHIADRLPTQSGNASFSLNVTSGDMVVRSLSNGRELPASRMNISVRNNTYAVVGSAVTVMTGNQPSSLVVTDNLNTVFRFQIANPVGTEISLGRVSLGVYATGLTFPGGMSVDDFELRRVINGREITNNLFSTTSANGQVVVFDALQEEYISPNSTAEYALKVRLENVGGTDGDSIGVQVLSDNNYSRSTLAGQRSSGRNFIWSDHSGRPHLSGSDDWLSGYLVNGISSDTVVIRR